MAQYQRIASSFLYAEEPETAVHEREPTRPSPGKVTLTSRLGASARTERRSGARAGARAAAPVQGYGGSLAGSPGGVIRGTPGPEAAPGASGSGARAYLLGEDIAPGEGCAGERAGSPVEVAQRGVQGAGAPLPHLAAIQRSFGPHDVGDVRAHLDGAAASAARELGARAYATGRDIAFGTSPDLHTAAHEAAHVVQQRRGVQVDGGMGRAGDAYERHADAVADRVVQGRSARALLDRGPSGGSGGGASGSAAVQRSEFGEKRSVDDQWEDATSGLTRRQAGALSTSLTWTGNLFQYAVMPSPQWDLLMTQCDQLQQDIGEMLASDITSRAAAELAPALAATNAVRGALEGARMPESEVKEKASDQLIGSGNALDQVVQYGVWVDDYGSVRVNTDDELEALLDGARPEKPEDGRERDVYPYTIPGTEHQILSKEGEDQFRQRFAPLTQDQLRYAGHISRLMIDQGLQFDDAATKASTLKSLQVSLAGHRMLLDDLMGGGGGEKVRLVLEGIRAKVDRAHEQVTAKLAPLSQALSRVQSLIVNIERPIRATLALRPYKHDPDWVTDLDDDGDLDRQPHLETRGMRRIEKTKLVPQPPVESESTDDTFEGVPPGGGVGDSPGGGPSGQSVNGQPGGDDLVVPATGGV